MTWHAGAPPPTNDEGSRVNASPQVEQETERANCGTAAPAFASAWPDNPDAERQRVAAADKRVTTLQARFARAGLAMHIIGAESVMVGRWGRFRELSLAEGEALIASISVSDRHA